MKRFCLLATLVAMFSIFGSTTAFADEETVKDGSVWDHPLYLSDGSNNIQRIDKGNDAVWYACKVPARQTIMIKNNYWPITVYFYTSDAEAAADKQEGDGNFNQNDVWSYDNKSQHEKTIYMKAVYTIGYAEFANVSVSFADLGEAKPTSSTVAGEYTGTYELTCFTSDNPFFNGLNGSVDDLTLTVEKSGDFTVNITSPGLALDGMTINSLTLKDVEVDEDGYLYGGTFEPAEIITGVATANAVTIDGKIDGTNANITFTTDLNVMGSSATATFLFATLAPDPTADNVVGEYTGTYELVDVVSGNDFFNGRTGSISDRTLQVTKSSDTTVNITTPLVSFTGITYYSFTVKDVTVDKEGYLSGGTCKNIQLGPWGTANTVTVSGRLDGTNADVNFVCDANIMNESSTVTLRFSAGSFTEIEEETYSFTNLEMDDTYGSAGMYALTANNDSIDMAFTIIGATVPGEYTDSVASLSLRFNHPDNTSTIVSSTHLYNASINIAEDYTPILKARFLANDEKIYNINAHFQKPEIKDTLSVNIDELGVIDNIDEFGAYFVYGYNRDTTNYVLIYCDAEKIPGHYTMKDLQAHRCHNYLVFIQDEAAGIYTKEFIYDADFDVTREDRKVNLVGDFQIGTHFVHMALEGTIPLVGIDYDNNNEDIDVSFTKDELTELQKDELTELRKEDVTQKAVYVRLQNEERNDIFSMYVYVDHYDDEITIPEGTYDIISTYQSGTVQMGDYINDTIYPTFYGYLVDGDQINHPLWYLRSGTVTVTKRNGELSFEVNALNSYERTVHIAYNMEDASVNTIYNKKESGIRKIIDNNKVIIMKNGQKYSVAGQIIK